MSTGPESYRKELPASSPRILAEVLTHMIRRHFPDAVIAAPEIPEAIGPWAVEIGKVRFSRGDDSVRPPRPPTVDVSFGVGPDMLTVDKRISGAGIARQALRRDIFRIFAGCEPGIPEPPFDRDLPLVGMSHEPGPTAGSILLYGAPNELYRAMLTNIGNDPELKELIPPSCRKLGF